MLNWYNETPERQFVQETIVDTALKELSLHERGTFDFWSEKIIRAAREKLGFVPPMVNYIALQNACIGRELAW